MKRPHDRVAKRRSITLIEWAEYLGVSRHTVRERINEYEEAGNRYEPRDIYSVLDFYTWLKKLPT